MDKDLYNMVKENGEKLDLIISVLSVHPDYEKFVKEGLMKREIESLKKELPIKNQARKKSIIEYIVRILEGKTYQVEMMQSGMMGGRSIAPNQECEPFEVELIEKVGRKIASMGGIERIQGNWSLDIFIDDKSLCPLLQKEITELFGLELDSENEIQKIKDKFKTK